jgi:hypothetical protein
VGRAHCTGLGHPPLRLWRRHLARRRDDDAHGHDTGAALAFFISGPATKFSTLSMLTAVFGKRLLGLYLIVMLGSALLWGYTYPFTSSYLETKIEWSAR